MGVNEKDFFSKLAGVGPDGKFADFSNGRQNEQQNPEGPRQGGDNGARKNYNNNNNETNSKMNNKDAKIENNNDEKDEKDEEMEVSDGEEGQLAVDVYAIPTSFVIESAIAGVKGDDIDVSITIDSVTIRGKRSKENKDQDKEYLCQECFWGRFSRTVILPQEIDADRSIASFKNGILRIILPKILRDKPKKLRVRFDQ